MNRDFNLPPGTRGDEEDTRVNCAGCGALFLPDKPTDDLCPRCVHADDQEDDEP